MPCIDFRLPLRWSGVGLLLSACGSPSPSPPPSVPTTSIRVPALIERAPAPIGAVTRLGPPNPVRSWGEVRLQAGRRLMQANPNGIYDGPVPEPLLAIPVLEIELNADGSVRRIEVIRRPRQALETVQLAIDAVHRAAPFGDVSRLPRPWKFAETFLFNEDRKFKPRSLDL